MTKRLSIALAALSALAFVGCEAGAYIEATRGRLISTLILGTGAGIAVALTVGFARQHDNPTGGNMNTQPWVQAYGDGAYYRAHGHAYRLITWQGRPLLQACPLLRDGGLEDDGADAWIDVDPRAFDTNAEFAALVRAVSNWKSA